MPNNQRSPHSDPSTSNSGSVGNSSSSLESRGNNGDSDSSSSSPGKRRTRRRIVRNAGAQHSRRTSYQPKKSSSDSPASTVSSSTARSMRSRRHLKTKQRQAQQRQNSRRNPETIIIPEFSFPNQEEAPIVSIAISTTGIHPTTARLVALAATFYNSRGDQVGEPLGIAFYSDTALATPFHMHGIDSDTLIQAPDFLSLLDPLTQLLEGRQVICHQLGYTWGFIRYEWIRARRAHIKAKRGKQSRQNQKNNKSNSAPRFPKVVSITDTLATARAQSIPEEDFRLRSISRHYGLMGDLRSGKPLADLKRDSSGDPAGDSRDSDYMPTIGAQASAERATIPGLDLLKADSVLTYALYKKQKDRDNRQDKRLQSGSGSAELVSTEPVSAESVSTEYPDSSIRFYTPDSLSSDDLGIQRSTVRVQAANASRSYENPGIWDGHSPLKKGMEFVISPDISLEAEELIQRATAAGLTYSEKLHRNSSVVVCNGNYSPQGKAMHAQRKDIPLVSDQDFLTLVENVEPGVEITPPQRGKSSARSSQRPRRSTQQKQKQKQGQKNQRGRQRNQKQAQKQSQKQGEQQRNQKQGDHQNGHNRSEQQHGQNQNGHQPNQKQNGRQSDQKNGQKKNSQNKKRSHKNRNTNRNSNNRNNDRNSDSKNKKRNSNPHRRRRNNRNSDNQNTTAES